MARTGVGARQVSPAFDSGDSQYPEYPEAATEDVRRAGVTCAYKAATLLLGLALTTVFGWWWADSLAALALLIWLVPEARETLESARAGRFGCDCGDE